MPTKSAPNLTMGNIADVCIWASTDRVMKFPKRYDYASNTELGFGSKRQGSQYRTGGRTGLSSGTIYFGYRSILVYRFGFIAILYN